MDAREQLRQWIDEQQGRLATGIPPGREAALLALVRAIDGLPLDREGADEPDILTGRWLPGLGVPTALRLALERPESEAAGEDRAGWAGELLDACRDLETARLVLRFAESGEMRLAEQAPDCLEAWRPGRAIPALWQERADIDRWAEKLASSGSQGRKRRDDAASLVARMAYQLPYPADAEIGGIAVSTYRAALAALIDLVSFGGSQNPLAERAVTRQVADVARCSEETAGRALSALILDPANAGWHAILPAGPQAPLVRIGPGQLAMSRRGVLSEPLFFLARELRRRDPERWHNAAHLREAEFRRDLYGLFDGRRFVTAVDPILLRWPDRRNRTDVDAVVFDRKTATLAVFELKSQDPFARSAQELDRQRDNLRRAGRQVAAILDWINRNGADDVLNRIDPATARRFRVQRVLPFVLGRYLGDPGEGRGNRRVAWGSWGQVLSLRYGASASNPLLSLHTRLLRDDREDLFRRQPEQARVIRLGERTLVVHPA